LKIKIANALSTGFAGAARVPDREWASTVRRVRSEFVEMPCTRLTIDQARAFFGLRDDQESRALLERLAEEGFLDRTEQGEYMRRLDEP
jgi:predicted transcriptional regulator of viral defense system